MELSEHLAAIRKTMGADRDNFYSQSCSGGFLTKTRWPQPSDKATNWILLFINIFIFQTNCFLNSFGGYCIQNQNLFKNLLIKEELLIKPENGPFSTTLLRFADLSDSLTTLHHCYYALSYVTMSTAREFFLLYIILCLGKQDQIFSERFHLDFTSSDKGF